MRKRGNERKGADASVIKKKHERNPMTKEQKRSMDATKKNTFSSWINKAVL